MIFILPYWVNFLMISCQISLSMSLSAPNNHPLLRFFSPPPPKTSFTRVSAWCRRELGKGSLSIHPGVILSYQAAWCHCSATILLWFIHATRVLPYTQTSIMIGSSSRPLYARRWLADNSYCKDRVGVALSSPWGVFWGFWGIRVS